MGDDLDCRELQCLRDWWRLELAEVWDPGQYNLPHAESDAVELPWRYRWDHLPKRTAGFAFSDADYQAWPAPGPRTFARLTLGDEVWSRVRRAGYVDLPSCPA